MACFSFPIDRDLRYTRGANINETDIRLY
jgi:hypothetical protein